VSQLPPAGWYPDPAGSPGLLRYWDGSDWGEGLRNTGTRLQSDPPISLPVPRAQPGSPWATYRSDLAWNARTLRSSPYFVLASVGLLAVVDLDTRGVIRPPRSPDF
jgi:hypothetical protein